MSVLINLSIHFLRHESTLYCAVLHCCVAWLFCFNHSTDNEHCKCPLQINIGLSRFIVELKVHYNKPSENQS